MGDWVQAFHDFAFENNGQFPTNFDQVIAYHEIAQGLERPGLVGVSPRTSAYFKSLTPDGFEIVFQGSLNTVTNPVNTIVIREKQPRQLPDGRWARIYGFADGSALQHIQPEGDFENWERAPQRPERAPPAVRRYSFYGHH